MAMMQAVLFVASLLVSAEGQCSQDGEDCRATQCCENADSTCFRKNNDWASCNATCAHNYLWENNQWNDKGCGAHFWDCDVLSPGGNDNPNGNPGPVIPAVGQINVNIYYEVDCPFTKNFVANEVGMLLATPNCVQDVTNFNWVPYGNADVTDTGNPSGCQHGEDECYGNRLHLCAKQHFGADNLGLTKWIVCHLTNLMKQGAVAHQQENYVGCPGANAAELEACATGDDSLNMLKEAGSATKVAAIQQAPWAVLETIPSYNMQTHFLVDICGQFDTPVAQGGVQGQLAKPACCATAVPFSGRRLLV